jgi:hypothetical protein
MTRNTSDSSRDWIRFTLLTIATYLALQTIIVVAHEYAHSITAWLLGYIPSPLTVIWGNPVTIRGWDEGVPYDRLFPSGGNPSEAVTGGIPLLMHTIFVIVGLYFLARPKPTERRPLFYAVYWFVVINLTELVAYLVMRPFAGSGDTGRFNEGLEISPWFLFVAGTVFILIALWVLMGRVMPRLDVVVDGSRTKHWIVVWMTAFIMFLWGSGLRIMSLYPDRQWKWGVVGIFAFFGWVLIDHLRTSSQLA